jgi:hypothetical protein
MNPFVGKVDPLSVVDYTLTYPTYLLDKDESKSLTVVMKIHSQ